MHLDGEAQDPPDDGYSIRPGRVYRETLAPIDPYGEISTFVRVETVSPAGIEVEFEIQLEHAPARPFDHTSLDPLAYALLTAATLLCLHGTRGDEARFTVRGLDFCRRVRGRFISGYLHVDGSGVDWARAGRHKLPVRMAEPGRPLAHLGHVGAAIRAADEPTAPGVS